MKTRWIIEICKKVNTLESVLDDFYVEVKMTAKLQSSCDFAKMCCLRRWNSVYKIKSSIVN